MLQGNVTSLSQQIENFATKTLPGLESQLGCKSRESLPHYLFVIGSGSNDYTFNYYARNSSSNVNVSLQAFTANLTALLSGQLKVKLHLRISLMGFYKVIKATFLIILFSIRHLMLIIIFINFIHQMHVRNDGNDAKLHDALWNIERENL